MDQGLNNSSTEQVGASKERVDSPEESGWTAYFEDFMAARREESINVCPSDGFGSSSMVSDATSCAAWELCNKDRAPLDPSEVRLKKFSKELMSLKKKRKKKMKKNRILDDEEEELEDTASSPVNSPKVCGLNQLSMKARKKGENKDSFQGTTSGHCSDHFDEIDESNELGFVGGNGSDYTVLNKRGLCLVPLSMLVDYLDNLP